MLGQDFGAGFEDPVRDAQGSFRAILDALANPGTVQNLVTTRDGSVNIATELVSALLTLSDHDTPIWLSRSLIEDASVRGFIGFHTGAPIVADVGKAAFAFIALGDDWPVLADANLGTQDYPDRSTTIIAAVPALSGGQKRVLRGPGIAETIEITPQGPPGDFSEQWAANRELFPRGVDLLLVADGKVLGLPRTSRIVEG